MSGLWWPELHKLLSTNILYPLSRKVGMSQMTAREVTHLKGTL